MTEADDPNVRQAIEALIHEYAWLVDHGQADRVPDLYTQDGRLLGVGPDKVGREAIAEWATQRAAMTQRRSRHVHSNIRLRSVSPGVVHATTILTLYRHDGEETGAAVPFMIGEFEDVFQRGADTGWRFAERRLHGVFGG